MQAVACEAAAGSLTRGGAAKCCCSEQLPSRLSSTGKTTRLSHHANDHDSCCRVGRSLVAEPCHRLKKHKFPTKDPQHGGGPVVLLHHQRALHSLHPLSPSYLPQCLDWDQLLPTPPWRPLGIGAVLRRVLHCFVVVY